MDTGHHQFDDARAGPQEPVHSSLVEQCLGECFEHGYSPTLEAWNERVRPVLEGFARDENDPRRAQEARDILDAWEESIALISHLWEARHEQRAARTAEESDPPEPGETPADECEQPE